MAGLPIKTEMLPDFCRRWKVRQFAVIGSVLCPDFSDSSDVDVVLTFAPDSAWSMFDIVTMRDELAVLFDRPVDIIEEAAVRNPYMLASIRKTKRVLYAA
ncbi:MAG: nucleotidyltransferase domain-containing protein [Planctomycetes bacterium]|nr:nucleotidyltransferase domain-containing protein [Planctomycetota bacterium]